MPRPNATAEDDGWVVVTVYDGATQKTDVVILDAQDVAAGPLATIHLPHHIPPGIYTCVLRGFCVPSSQLPPCIPV